MASPLVQSQSKRWSLCACSSSGWHASTTCCTTRPLSWNCAPAKAPAAQYPHRGRDRTGPERVDTLEASNPEPPAWRARPAMLETLYPPACAGASWWPCARRPGQRARHRAHPPGQGSKDRVVPIGERAVAGLRSTSRRSAPVPGGSARATTAPCSWPNTARHAGAQLSGIVKKTMKRRSWSASRRRTRTPLPLFARLRHPHAGGRADIRYISPAGPQQADHHRGLYAGQHPAIEAVHERTHRRGCRPRQKR